MRSSQKHPRRSLELSVEITTDERAQPTTTYRTADVSQGGIFIVLRDPPPVGTMVKFNIKMDEAPVRGIGRVTWIRVHGDGPEKPSGMGIEFRVFQENDRFILLRTLFDVPTVGSIKEAPTKKD